MTLDIGTRPHHFLISNNLGRKREYCPTADAN